MFDASKQLARRSRPTSNRSRRRCTQRSPPCKLWAAASTAWDAEEAPSHEPMRTQGGACGRYSDLGALAVEREQAHDLCPGLIALEGQMPGAGHLTWEGSESSASTQAISAHDSTSC